MSFLKDLFSSETHDANLAEKRGYDAGFRAGEAGEAMPDTQANWLYSDGHRETMVGDEQIAYRNAVINGYHEAKNELAANKRALKW